MLFLEPEDQKVGLARHECRDRLSQPSVLGSTLLRSFDEDLIGKKNTPNLMVPFGTPTMLVPIGQEVGKVPSEDTPSSRPVQAAAGHRSSLGRQFGFTPQAPRLALVGHLIFAGCRAAGGLGVCTVLVHTTGVLRFVTCTLWTLAVAIRSCVVGASRALICQTLDFS